jgi:hypothetical protein
MAMVWEGQVLSDDPTISGENSKKDQTALGTNGMTANGWRALSNCGKHFCMG